jgi:hypothetical protein
MGIDLSPLPFGINDFEKWDERLLNETDSTQKHI